jgi:hypothetical protein
MGTIIGNVFMGTNTVFGLATPPAPSVDSDAQAFETTLGRQV